MKHNKSKTQILTSLGSDSTTINKKHLRDSSPLQHWCYWLHQPPTEEFRFFHLHGFNNQILYREITQKCSIKLSIKYDQIITFISYTPMWLKFFINYC